MRSKPQRRKPTSGPCLICECSLTRTGALIYLEERKDTHDEDYAFFIFYFGDLGHLL